MLSLQHLNRVMMPMMLFLWLGRPLPFTIAALTVEGATTIPRNAGSANAAVVSLQLPHAKHSPASTLSFLAQDCETLGISAFDVYGDLDSSKGSSYLAQFEDEVAADFGKEDAVFMPSGVMAQNIVLLINGGTRAAFACHESSHLLLHEQQAYKHLLQMHPIVISTTNPHADNGVSTDDDSFRIRPLEYNDVIEALSNNGDDGNDDDDDKMNVGTLILELPHRELGGKCTPWQDIEKIKEYCDSRGIKFHCDGARIFEATAGYEKSVKELVEPFDSVYISFYKGLGGLSGAMLLGSYDFCNEARVWLRRFGGNLYTLLPYAVSGWSGYRKRFVNADITFRDKQQKMARIVELLSSDNQIRSSVKFDPAIPEVNMIHGYLFATKEECMNASAVVEEQSNIRVLSRIRSVEESDPAYRHGYRSKFELSIGDANYAIDDSVFLQGWNAFVAALDASKSR